MRGAPARTRPAFPIRRFHAHRDGPSPPTASLHIAPAHASLNHGHAGNGRLSPARHHHALCERPHGILAEASISHALEHHHRYRCDAFRRTPGTLRTCGRNVSPFPHRIQSNASSTSTPCPAPRETQTTPAIPCPAPRETQTTPATPCPAPRETQTTPATPCRAPRETQATPACPPRALRETQTTRATRKTPICSDSYEAWAAPVSPPPPTPQARAVRVSPASPSPQARAAPLSPARSSPRGSARPRLPVRSEAQTAANWLHDGLYRSRAPHCRFDAPASTRP